MQILGAGKLPVRFVLLASALALTAACGGTTVFSGKGPVSIAGEAPAPPPPPPPPAKPPEPPPKVVVKDNKIEITEKIQFEYNKAVILPQSFDLLTEISDTIKKNPHIKKIAIEGHASSEGDPKRNMKLSDERANAVKTHLVEKGGLPATMFTAKGFGITKPIADNSTEEGKEKNRRVEFNIIEQDITKKKLQVDATGKETVLEEKTSTDKKEVADIPEQPKKPVKGDKKEDKGDKKEDKGDKKEDKGDKKKDAK